MVEQSEFCQYYYRDMEGATLPDARLALRLRRCWWTLKRYVWYVRVLGLCGFGSRVLSSMRLGRFASRGGGASVGGDGEVLDLQEGEWVEVRSAREIFGTLDGQDKLRGLRFTPEMVKFCGRRFRVYKRLDKIILEATGELRRIRTPTVLLEGVFCDGAGHGGCDRCCFCFWRERWLRRASWGVSWVRSGV
jgi:hypothetical protein